MQTESLKLVNQSTWQELLASSVTHSQELLSHLQLPMDQLPGLHQAQKDFSLRVPQPYLDRIQIGNPKDPLLLQILPQRQETIEMPGYVTDPLGEAASNQQQGIIHKYHGRLLLIISGGCAINCRYCFRRHFPYQENQLGKQQWLEILDYLKQDTSVEEIIFSGGDPLATTDKRLKTMINDLETIPHLKRLRIHTRLPVVIPQRVTPALLSMLARSRFKIVLVNHINHAQEIDQQVQAAMAELKHSGITLLNQSVLLKDINDNLQTLIDLSEALFDIDILPYYLHLLDPVKGASHFAVSEQRGQILVGQMSDRLPGYLVPKLVKEIAGASAKVPIRPILGNIGT